MRHKHAALCSVGHMSAISAACKACVQQHITEAGVPRKERYLLDEYIFLLIDGADATLIQSAAEDSFATSAELPPALKWLPCRSDLWKR